MAIGEAGTIQENTTFTGEPIVVTFTEALTDPVISLTSTNFGGNKFSLRVIDIQTNASGDATGFRFTIDEWENHDGPHGRLEDINWLAIESGVHTLPDGRVIEAGYSDADSDGESVALAGGFTNPPVVLTTVASDNHPSVVDSDPFNITASGFDLNVEEAESQDGIHDLENVGWIAIGVGGDGTSGTALTSDVLDSAWKSFGIGANYTNPIVAAETQTQNDPDTGNIEWRNLTADQIEMRFEEDTSVDGDTGHADETVGIVAFEAGLILCFVDGTMIRTPHGDKCIEDLQEGDQVITSEDKLEEIKWVCSEYMSQDAVEIDPELAPIIISKDSLGPGLPEFDLRVSPQHRILISNWRAEFYFGEREVLVPAKALVNGTTIRREVVGDFSYCHLMTGRHEIIFANGIKTESFHAGEMSKIALTSLARESLFEACADLRSSTDAFGPLARPQIRASQAQLLMT